MGKTTEDLAKEIKSCQSHQGLKNLWDNRRLPDGTSLWPKGKLMEYMVVRAFELESSDTKPVNVTYPYDVREEVINNYSSEQIDGAVHVMDLHALIECKDYNDNYIEVEPLVKLRFRLQVRHSSVFGIFFSCTEMTKPADYWLKFMAPQLIIFWGEDDINYCLEYGCFVDCLETKYRRAIDNRDYNFQYHQSKKDLEVCTPLF